MITVKKLSDCTLTEAVQAFNQGFEHYYVPFHLNTEQLVVFLHNGRVSPELSYVAFVDDNPAGFLLNSIKIINGVKIARNAGTAVAGAYRRHGIGKILMERALEMYSQEKVETAMLEAFSVNYKAIALYEQFGYEVTDRLLFLEHKGALDAGAFTASQDARTSSFEAIHGLPRDVGSLPFYNHDVPWQNYWEHVASGESLLIVDEYGNAAGYAVFRKSLDSAGSPQSIVLHQAEAKPDHPKADAVLRFALSKVFEPLEYECRRSTFNLPESSQAVVRLLEEAGFQSGMLNEEVPMEQVHMKKWLK